MITNSEVRKYKKLRETSGMKDVELIVFLIERLKTRGGYTSLPPKVLTSHRIDIESLGCLSNPVIYWCQLNNTDVTFNPETNTFHF